MFRRIRQITKSDWNLINDARNVTAEILDKRRNTQVKDVRMEFGVTCRAYPQHHFMHGVQLCQVLLCVRVWVVQVDGGGSSMTGLSYHSSQRPGQLMNQIWPDNNILNQPARRPGSRSRHFPSVQEPVQLFIFRVSSCALGVSDALWWLLSWWNTISLFMAQRTTSSHFSKDVQYVVNILSQKENKVSFFCQLSAYSFTCWCVAVSYLSKDWLRIVFLRKYF